MSIATDQPSTALISAWTASGIRERLRATHYEAFCQGWEAALSASTASPESLGVSQDEPSPTHVAEATATEAQHAGQWRPEVRAFADLMEAKLRENDHKPGWKSDDPEGLLRRLAHECDELGDVVRWHKYYDTADRGARLGPVHRAGVIGAEAADVANFAMMIADVSGSLTAPPSPAPPSSEREGSRAGERCLDAEGKAP